MALGEDLAPEVLGELLGPRPVRSYPALASTEAEAVAWARAGAPEGAVVVADYQIAARGRAGWEWVVRPGRSLGFSLVLRPRWPAGREGWLYSLGSLGLAAALGDDTTVEWPDEVRAGGQRAGAVAVEVEEGPGGVVWGVVNVLVDEATPPRGPLLAEIVGAVEARYRGETDHILLEHRRKVETIGKHVVARIIPVGPGGVRISGVADSTDAGGALVVQTAENRLVRVYPQDVGVFQSATEPPPEDNGPGVP